MSEQDNIFASDWRDCLEAHYKDVVQRNDKITEDTLKGVLHDVGYSDDDLRQIKLHATMRADDLADDFIPDLELEAEDEAPVYEGVDIPVDPVEPIEVEPDDEEELLTVDEQQAVTEEAETPPTEEVEIDEPLAIQPDPAEPEDDAPQQLSMF